ncbi:MULTISPECIES: phage virion morphogenesis protein [unclassified Maridesulfovibrio]|uniref:phage virion morphogenesis protein n=1 Tax=unclassified Maridesulfovibrio TaxID=2794999 RepID=UPI003B40EF64
MGGAIITVDLDTEVVKARLNRLAEVVSDLTPLMEQIGMSMVASTQNRFETSTAPDGSKWLDSPSDQPLLRDRHLQDSITYEAKSDRVDVGSNMIYAAVHQFGAIIKPKNAKALCFQAGEGMVVVKQVEVPARPYLGMDDDDEQDIDQITEEFLSYALEG